MTWVAKEPQFMMLPLMILMLTTECILFMKLSAFIRAGRKKMFPKIHSMNPLSLIYSWKYLHLRPKFETRLVDFHYTLPLAVERGVQGLIAAYPEAVEIPDPETKLYPFMLAATAGEGKNNCSTIFELMRLTIDS